MTRQKIQLEYIWLDGSKPQQLRSKTKVHAVSCEADLDIKKIPEWAFDGSSTNQSKGEVSDLKLKPVEIVPDPIRGHPNMLVMCEVLNPDGTPHATNARHYLSAVENKYKEEEPWFGIEQEYTLYKLNPMRLYPEPLAWVELNNKPGSQGPYYCGVGAGKVFGRKLIEEHTKKCLEAGLEIWGTNAEVMPGQWEFQIGPLSPLKVADRLWLARWLLIRLGEDFGIEVSFSPKPLREWNGAGAHTNFSTKNMRDSDNGKEVILEACKYLEMNHTEHIKVYGEGNEKRLVGAYETSSIDKFTSGEMDRTASVRIPMETLNKNKGYLEDRRPAANMDPYLVCRAILETVCGDGFKG